jgi:hypothetical protein
MFKPGINDYIKGLDNHEFTDIPIGIVRGVIIIPKEHDIIVLHLYALIGKARSIHLSCPLGWYNNDNDKSVLFTNGLQCIIKLKRYIIEYQ